MSQKRKVQRARHQAEIEKKGKDVVLWIIVALIAFALVYMGITIYSMM